MSVNNFSFIGIVIFILVVVLVVLAIKRLLGPRKKTEQENEALKKELNYYKYKK